MPALMIVESSIKARQIAKYFPGMIVRSTVGHIRELPVKEMGVYSPEFQPSYQIIAKKSNVVGALRKAANQADIIYLATDLDREGEAIAWHVNQTLDRAARRKTIRVRYNEVSKQAIQTAINNATELDTNLVHAQEARRVIDRFVGYIVSPELNRLLKRRGLSAGRVQSAVLKIICSLEKNIEAFESRDHFGLRIYLQHDDVKFFADWNFKRHLNEGETLLLDKNLALDVQSRTQYVESLNSEEQQKRVPPPKTLVTSELIQSASSLFKASAKEAMNAAQNLFERGLITYHRTDSHFIAPEFVESIRTFAVHHQLSVTKDPRLPGRRKNAQEAHECIRVTSFQDPSSTLNQLESLEQKLYQLIFYRTLCSQLEDCIENHKIQRFVNDSDVVSGGDEFVAKNVSIEFKGWKAAEHFSPVLKKTSPDQEGTQFFPEIEPLKRLDVLDSELLMKRTRPPVRYTEASLVKKMESTGIGRPSTYASIIETLISRRYIKRLKGNLHPADLGRLVFAILDGAYQFMCLEYTAELEEMFDSIAKGGRSYLETVRSTYQQLQEETSRFADTKKNQIAHLLNAFSVSSSKTSKGSSHKPEENNALNRVSHKIKTGDKCSSCAIGKHTLRTFNKGKNTGKQYFGCTHFPDCRFFQWAH